MVMASILLTVTQKQDDKSQKITQCGLRRHLMPILPRKTYFFWVRNVSTQLHKRNFQGNSELFRKSLQYDSSTVELLESPFGRKPAKNAIFRGFMCQNRQQLHPSHLGHQTYEQHQPSALLPDGIGMGYLSGGSIFFGPGNFPFDLSFEVTKSTH